MDAVSRTTVKSAPKLPVPYDGRRLHRETLSPFDVTEYRGRAFPGEHPPAPVTDFLAPGERQKTRSARASPSDYLRGHSGLGGTSSARAGRAAEAQRAQRASRAATEGPPSAGSTARRPNPPNTELRRSYERSDLPIIIQQGARNKLSWKIEPARLDYHHYLPLFMSGIREVEEPFHFIAEEGVYDLLRAGGETKVLPVLPQLIMPIKHALNTRDRVVVVRALRVLQALLDLGDGIGRALVPYYRQLLPVLNIFINHTVSLGDGIDYAQRRGHIGEAVRDTLNKLEARGGPDALINLTYLIPTYSKVRSV